MVVREIREHLFVPAVLPFKALYSQQVRSVQSTVLLTLLIKRGGAHAHLSTDVFHCHAGLCLLQRTHNLVL